MFRSKVHNLFTEKFNRINLSANDDQRLQAIDQMISYSYGTGPEKVLMRHSKIKN